VPPETIRQRAPRRPRRARPRSRRSASVLLPLRLHRLGEGTALAAITCIKARPGRPERPLVDRLRPLRHAQDHAAARPAQVLWVVVVTNCSGGRAMVEVRHHEAGDVGDVGHDQRPRLVAIARSRGKSMILGRPTPRTR